MERYQVISLGRCVAGAEPATVFKQLRRRFSRIEPARLRGLLANKPVVVRGDLDLRQARQLSQQLRGCGLQAGLRLTTDTRLLRAALKPATGKTKTPDTGPSTQLRFPMQKLGGAIWTSPMRLPLAPGRAPDTPHLHLPGPLLGRYFGFMIAAGAALVMQRYLLYIGARLFGDSLLLTVTSVVFLLATIWLLPVLLSPRRVMIVGPDEDAGPAWVCAERKKPGWLQDRFELIDDDGMVIGELSRSRSDPRKVDCTVDDDEHMRFEPGNDAKAVADDLATDLRKTIVGLGLFDVIRDWLAQLAPGALAHGSKKAFEAIPLLGHVFDARHQPVAEVRRGKDGGVRFLNPDLDDADRARTTAIALLALGVV